MPYPNKIPEVTTSPQQRAAEHAAILKAEIKRLEGVRDTAVSQARTDEQKELARAAWQKEVDKAQERLTQAGG